jgi:type II secretory pathway pseudopilin PulG
MISTRGLTFVESLIWVAVFVVSMMAFIVSLLSFYRANTYTLEQAEAVSDARRAIERVVQTLRETDYAANGAYPLVAIGTSTVTFYADIDSEPQPERIRYFLDGTNLQRGVVEPTGDPADYTGAETVTTVAPYIRNGEQGTTTFRFYDTLGTEVTSAADIQDIRYVHLSVIVNVSPFRLPNELTMHSSATLRNLR